MGTKAVGAYVALLVIFAAIGLTQFSENVRTVQILGLFASGAVFGIAVAMISASLRKKQKEA